MFVQRDGQGNIKGLYAQLQPGYAEEEIAKDHPDVIAYTTAVPRSPATIDPVDAWLNEMRADPTKLDKLKALIAKP